MATIYDVSVTNDIDVSVEEFWGACRDKERDELRDLVVTEYKLDPVDSLDSAIIRSVGELADGHEAKDYIRKVLADMVWKLKNRDFS